MRPLYMSCVALAALALSAGAAAQDRVKITTSPRLVTEGNPVEITVSGDTDCGSTWQEPPRIEGRRITLPVRINFTCDPPIGNSYSETFSVGPLKAGLWTVEALEEGAPAGSRTLDVEPLATELFFHDRRFRVRVEWSTPDGTLHGEAHGLPLSDDAGYLWFFESRNPEILVKILDGRPVNGRWWVFISSNTNLEFKVHVRRRIESDPPFNQEKTYASPAGANQNFIDTTSFRDN